ncbi:MAG: hybrid sensor histidine kinase/response regulator [Oscillospiraceae bacterium]
MNRLSHSNKGSGIRPSFFIAVLLFSLLLFVCTVLWVRSSGNASEQMINLLGEFYLQEIADRNANTISVRIQDRTDQISRAVDELDTEQLKDEETVRKYISMVQNLNGLDIFALVDENGMVYTADSTFSGISRFGFLSEDAENTAVYSIKSYGTKTMLAITVPVEHRQTDGIHITSCFTAIDVESIISAEQLQNAENRIFCRMFDRDGNNLLRINGEYPHGENLFDIYESKAIFSSGFSLEKMRDDWHNGTAGYCVYSIGGNESTYVYYKAVPGTDWIITALMRENNINDVVESGAQDMVRYSVIMIAAVSVAIIVFLIYIMVNAQKMRRIRSDSEQLKIVGALSNDYSDIFLMDPLRDSSITMKEHGQMRAASKNESRSYAETWKRYADTFVYAEDLQTVLDTVSADNISLIMKNNEEYSIDFRAEYDNEIHYIQVKFVRLFGETDRLIVGFRNIDEQMKAEAERRKTLQNAFDDAQRANRAKTSFLNNMSHDIRTPMNAIIGFTNIALKKETSPEVQDCLEKISESSEHLLALINDVLDISRIESGKTRISPVPVNISAVMDSVLDITHGFISSRELTLNVKRNPPKHPYVLADAVRIREVLVNIISNAVKFTNDGGSISFTEENLAGDSEGQIIMRYTVSDNGIGMSREFLGRIFDEFSQENSGARTQYKGTGLGMSITKRYVEMMGGTISVESEQGAGTTVTVEIPLELTAAENVPQDVMPTEHADLTGVKVLLAEDNDLNAEIASVQLESCGMKITRTTDGKETYEAFANSPAGTFDIILMDIMMPNMNGYEAARAIRATANREDARTIPIIAMTANAFAEDVQASFDAGMNAHIAKPLVMAEVMNVISRNLNTLSR